MRVEVHGHRGARGLRPENTLPGVAHAIELGVDAIEFDIVLTADDELVATHDLAVDADLCTGAFAGRPIRELTLEQLKGLDCGSRHGDDDGFADTHVDIPGTPMPTLSEVLELIGATSGMWANVELKSDPTRPALCGDPHEFTKRVVAEIRRHDMLDRSRLLSFDWRILQAAIDLVPDVPRYGNVEPDTLTPEWIGEHPYDGDIPALAKAAGSDVLSLSRKLIDETVMEQAAAAGIPIVAWTVNDPDEARRLVDLGVTAVVTDYPDVIKPAVTRSTS